MPTNDFLPFATQPAANVLTQSDYVALAARLTGYVRGRAASAELNKTWRQSSFIAAGLAQFITEQLSVDVLDDGDLEGFVAKLKLGFLAAAPREKLATPTTFYVSPSGNDSNDGSIGSPFRTIGHAYQFIVSTLDFGGQTITIQLADGIYNSSVVASGAAMGATALTPITIQGNAANRNNVTIATVGSDGLDVQLGAGIWIKDLTIGVTSAAGVGNYAIAASYGGVARFSNLNFLSCPFNHLYASAGGRILCEGDYTISGSATYHGGGVGGGYCQLSGVTPIVTTINGSVNFSGAYVQAGSGGVINAPSNLWVNSVGVTGSRYAAYLNGVIQGGGGAGFFPGSIAGTTVTGGQYA